MGGTYIELPGGLIFSYRYLNLWKQAVENLWFEEHDDLLEAWYVDLDSMTN